jgi:thermitase
MMKRLKYLVAVVLSAGLVAQLGWNAGATASSRKISAARLLQAEHVPDELIVRLEGASGASANAETVSLLNDKLGAGAIESVRPLATDPTLQKVRLKSRSLVTALEALRADPSIEIAEPNFIYRHTGTPNDASFAQLWGMHNTAQRDNAGQVGKEGSDIDVVRAWDQGFRGDRRVIVAVIDTGIDWDHPDLMANLWTNPREIAGNGKDDDANGFVDDIRGWNFVANTANSRDDNRHGTHCAGTIGGLGNNGVGVAGVNWQVSLVPVKFLDGSGSGTLENAVNAINYARTIGVHVMSNSWGGGGFSEALFKSIQATRDAGILFVAAAGNDGRNNDDVPTYPSTYDVDNIVSVAASDNQDKPASFTSYGRRTVHVAAPGVQIYSTTPNNGYAYLSGTSMATPHVAGIAALMMAADPSWSYAEIKRRLIATSDPAGPLRRKVVSRGRVNAWNAIMNVVPQNPDPDESLWRDVPMPIENAHPYPNGASIDFPIYVPDAKYIRVHFETFSLENGYDRVQLLDPFGGVVDEISGKGNDLPSEYYAGNRLTVRLTSDGSVTDFGFKIDKVQVISGP